MKEKFKILGDDDISQSLISCSCGSDRIAFHYHYTGLELICNSCGNHVILHAKEYGKQYFGLENNTSIFPCDCLVEFGYEDKLKFSR
jgi:hypothetical protein